MCVGNPVVKAEDVLPAAVSLRNRGRVFSLDLAEVNFQFDRRLLRFRVLMTESWALLATSNSRLPAGPWVLRGNESLET
jgi:hypothetical protein